MRSNELFTRNAFYGSGIYEIPIIEKQEIKLNHIELISFSDTRINDSESNKRKGVHFFLDDYRFENVYRNPEQSIARLSQYSFLLTPDFSMYADMMTWRQIESVAHSRWVGAYWQEQGLSVIPTISWSTKESFEYCFDGVEKNSIVAIGMIGCKRNKREFLLGYEKMLERIEPSHIICYGNPFTEMQGNLIVVDYFKSRMVVR